MEDNNEKNNVAHVVGCCGNGWRGGPSLRLCEVGFAGSISDR
jgi:hypothetical protein